MSMLRTIGCKVGWHRWGPIVGDVAGGHRTCLSCDKEKRVDTRKPPEAHDKSGIHT